MIVTYPVGDFIPDAPQTTQGLDIANGFFPAYGSGLRTIRGTRGVSAFTGSTATTNSFYFKSIVNSNEFHYVHNSSDLKIYRANVRGQAPYTSVGSFSYNSNNVGPCFLQWGEDVIFVNGGTAQVCQNQGSSFINLMTSSTKPSITLATVCYNHLVGANAPGASDTVYWSAFDNPQDFQPSIVTGAGSQRIVDIPGAITGLVGGETVLVFKSSGISLMSYEGAPYTFAIRTLSGSYGTNYGNSIIQKGDNVYFYSSEGFKRVTNRSFVEDVGQGKIESFFRAPDGNNSIGTGASSLRAFYDANSGLIGWAYNSPTLGYSGNKLNCIIFYDESSDRWSFYRNDTDTIAAVSSNSTYVDVNTAAVDPLSACVCLFAYAGTNFSGGAFSSTASSPYSFSTKRITLQEDGVVFIRAVRLMAKMGDQTVASPPGTYKVQLSSDPFFVTMDSVITSSTPSNDGWIPILAEGQFCRITYSGGPDFTLNRFFSELIAIQFDIEPAGSAGA